MINFLYSKIQRVLSPLVVDNHYKSLREIAAVTYNSDICNKNFLYSLIIFIIICDVSSSLF